MYCQNATKSRLTYKTPSGTTKTVGLPPGIEVRIERINKVRNCWRFWGVGIFGQPIECFASGFNPEWVRPPNSPYIYPYMDGYQLYRGSYTMQFVSATGLELVDVFEGKEGGWVYGECDSFGGAGGTTCKILVNEGQLLSDLIQCPGVFTVACGDECPPGTCKCPTDSYPGYCCLDCSAVAARLNNMAERLRCG